jgi:MarR family transcriptional regulator, transcriptional regulator for hemolysin
MAAAGGSQPTWLVLIALKTLPARNQRELAATVGIQGATLTHHLNAMESDGLVTRRRDPANRRVHLVEMTERGEALFHELREAATAFDRRLRAGLTAEEVAALGSLLGRLAENAGGQKSMTE